MKQGAKIENLVQQKSMIEGIQSICYDLQIQTLGFVILFRLQYVISCSSEVLTNNSHSSLS